MKSFTGRNSSFFFSLRLHPYAFIAHSPTHLSETCAAGGDLSRQGNCSVCGTCCPAPTAGLRPAAASRKSQRARAHRSESEFAPEPWRGRVEQAGSRLCVFWSSASPLILNKCPQLGHVASEAGLLKCSEHGRKQEATARRFGDVPVGLLVPISDKHQTIKSQRRENHSVSPRTV